MIEAGDFGQVIEVENGFIHSSDMGHETAFASITGGIFEFGFSDAILQMWAAFLHKMELGGPIKQFTGCATPEEAALSHRLFAAALASHENATAAVVE